MDRETTTEKEQRRYNSTYPKGGVSCSKNSFVVNQSLVFSASIFVVKIATFAKPKNVGYLEKP